MALSKIETIKGFSVLAVKLENPKPYKTQDPVYNYIYLKKHTTSTVSSSQTRSLFLVNLPIDTTLPQIKKIFQDVAIGAIVESFQSNDYYDSHQIGINELNIDISKLSNEDIGGIEEDNKGDNNNNNSKIPLGCGIVTFLDKNGLNLALQSIKKIISSGKNIPIWPKDLQEIGTERYMNNYKSKIMDSESLEIESAESVLEFARKEQEAKDEIDNMKTITDEDGFTMVVGSHRKTKTGIMGSLKKTNEIEKEKAVKKMKRKEKQDFYRFQIREKKKQEMNHLLAKFKEDQERVKEMKEKRRFRPY
ncbi:hypothetical protein B5S28_g1874 [[Candida] boidinii]|nr:hypothetical protein B5S28_g1874 [[Candida] boidinii]OWB61725.1 hypothetical protein B5S29_g2628 [[Candida] boidinii]